MNGGRRFAPSTALVSRSRSRATRLAVEAVAGRDSRGRPTMLSGTATPARLSTVGATSTSSEYGERLVEGDVRYPAG